MRLRLSLAALGLALVAARPAAAQDSFGYPAGPTPAPSQPAPPAKPVKPAKPTPAAPAADADPSVAAERQDFGVPATAELHTGPMHAPTPNTIPGGQVVTTKGVVALLGNQQLQAKIFDVLGGPEVIPGAEYAVPAAQPGSFTDQNQQAFGQYLQQVTQGNPETPLVFYCLSSHCWMSYNASLRAINLGYKNVLWYRGGIEAWKAAGQQTQPAPRRQ